MPQAKTLTDKELNIVLAVVAQGRNAIRNRIMMLISHMAGLRVGEIAALKIFDVLRDDGSVKEEIWLKPEQTKGKKGRVVMICEKLQQEIAKYLKTLKNHTPDSPLIPSQKSRTGFSANSLGQEFKKIYQKADLEGATSHSGRRTFITKLANRGVSVRVLMALAGHQSIATTQRYIDVNDDIMRNAVNLI